VNRYATILAVTTAAQIGAASVAAAQGQVYDPLPPPGSAYVRFMNSLDGDLEVRPEFLPVQSLGSTSANRVTSYFVVDKVAGRDLAAEIRGMNRVGHATFRVEPGTFINVIVQAGPGRDIVAVPVSDRTDFNQTRARLSFYNASPACPSATLMLADGGTAVFQNIAPGTAKARGVNPVETDVIASCDGHNAPALPLHGLGAGGMYSIWMM